MIKDRNSEDLTEAEEIKKRWQEYTEELYRKALIDPDNHNGVVDHLESDILECEVNWDFGSIIMNKASGNDVIPAELFKILKKMLLKCCAQYVMVPFYCEDFTQWVVLDYWLVEVSWLGKLVSMFWSVGMDFFYLECNGVPSDEFCNGSMC